MTTIRLFALSLFFFACAALAQDFGLPTNTAGSNFRYVGPGSSVAAGAMPESPVVNTGRSREAGGAGAAVDGIAHGTRNGIKRSSFISSFGTKRPGFGMPGSAPYFAPGAHWTTGTAGDHGFTGPGSSIGGREPGSTGGGDLTGGTGSATGGGEPGSTGGTGDVAGTGTGGASDGTGGPEPTEEPTEVSTGDVVVNGVTFTIGPYEPPELQHDLGFLQNTNDLSDTVPIPLREPNFNESWYYQMQLEAAILGTAFGWVPADGIYEGFAWDDAVPAYLHYLTGDGADYTFDMDKYLTEDPGGQILEETLLKDAEAAIHSALYDLEDAGELKPGETVSFTITSDPVRTAYGDPFYPAPTTVNWQRAVGEMDVWTTTEVIATVQEDGTILMETVTTIHGEDRYNFNPDAAAIDSGEPDALRGEQLTQTGLAHQFTQTGEATRRVLRMLRLP